MSKFNVKVFNDGGGLIYDNCIEAKSENEAIKIMLDDTCIYAGDRILIDEI